MTTTECQRSLSDFISEVYESGEWDTERYNLKDMQCLILDYNQCSGNESNLILFCSVFARDSDDGRKKFMQCDREDCTVYIQEQIVNPLLFYLNQFKVQLSDSDHIKQFVKGPFNAPLRWSKSRCYWSANGKIPLPAEFEKNRENIHSQCFMSVCHLVQKEHGTAVHVGSGNIVTCAHCIALDNTNQAQIGSTKYVIFANKKICRCRVIQINPHKNIDLALMKIEAPLNQSITKDKFIQDVGIAKMRQREFEQKTCLFTIGAPCEYDVESNQKYKTNFEPKIFHASFGYLMEEKSGSFSHSCWTYFGHSGAPLFDLQGNLVGIHDSADSVTGVRFATNLTAIRAFLGDVVQSIDKHDS